MSIFQAVWPVTDPTLPRQELIAEATADLPWVAARHRARITGEPRFDLRPGRNIPGSQGAHLVVVAAAEAEALEHRSYGWVKVPA